MRILVCGARDFSDRELLCRAFDIAQQKLDQDPIIIHGNANGADIMGGNEALKRKLWCWPCPARWSTQGKAAGPLRNQRMLVEAQPDWILAFPGKASKGTWDMIRRSENAGLPVWIVQRNRLELKLETRNCQAEENALR